MTRRKDRTAWNLIPFAALTAVVAFASPAAAADQSSTTVQASPSTQVVGQSVTLTATVTCPESPVGGLGVTFFDGQNLLETVPVDAAGTAVFPTELTTVGSHVFTAAYNGNTDCSASNDTTTVEVSATPVPPTSPGGFCLLACGGLINFQTGDIHNEINIYQRGR